MKATDFVARFEFSIRRIPFEELPEEEKEEFEGDEVVYEVSDDQGVFDSRYINHVSDLVNCFDSMLNDYVNDNIEEDGFEYNEDTSWKGYYEQALDWCEQQEDYRNSYLKEIIRCLAYPSAIEDDTEV